MMTHERTIRGSRLGRGTCMYLELCNNSGLVKTLRGLENSGGRDENIPSHYGLPVPSSSIEESGSPLPLVF